MEKYGKSSNYTKGQKTLVNGASKLQAKQQTKQSGGSGSKSIGPNVTKLQIGGQLFQNKK